MERMRRLERRLERAERRLRVLTVMLVLGGVTVATTAAIDAPQEADVLRARGLVLMDDRGRERIVLGAPMGNASRDPKLAAATGLAVRDTAGRLDVAVGSENPLVGPDGEVGERVASSAGLTIYDPRTGRERGGFGVLADGRANACLDYGTGVKEAACMAVAPQDRYAAFILNGTPEEEVYDRATMYVDADGSGSIKVFGGGANQGGVMIRAGSGRLPSVAVYDSTGEEVGDLVER